MPNANGRGAQYKLIINNASGIKQAEIVNYLALGYSKRVGRVGALKTALPSSASIVASIANDWQVEVWRRNLDLGVDWYQDFIGLFKDEKSTKVNGLDRFEMTLPEDKELLRQRVVAWPAGVVNRSAFTSQRAETISKNLVTYNASASATTANGRITDGAFVGKTVTVQADAAGGNLLDWRCAGDNLIETLYSLSLIGGGDFDLIKTGAVTWDFRWYLGQRGVNRTATVLFATQYGNMLTPSYSVARMEEKTVAIVGGESQGIDRVYRTRTGPNYSTSHKVEAFVDGRQDKTTAALDARGDAALEKAQAKTLFGFEIGQTPGTAYGVHYCVAGVMGDLVTAQFNTIETAVKIAGVTVASQTGKGESVKVELEIQ